MTAAALQPSLPAGRPLSAAEQALLARARGLAAGAAPLLAGKHIGLVCASADSAEARVFIDAAQALGAKVSHLRPSLGAASSDAEVATTARMLGRLYDAVEFLQGPPALARRIGREAGVPVFDGIAGEAHASAVLAIRLEGLPPEQARRCLVQALLLAALP